jgi:hypothetical protein
LPYHEHRASPRLDMAELRRTICRTYMIPPGPFHRLLRLVIPRITITATNATQTLFDRHHISITVFSVVRPRWRRSQEPPAASGVDSSDPQLKRCVIFVLCANPNRDVNHGQMISLKVSAHCRKRTAPEFAIQIHHELSGKRRYAGFADLISNRIG